jgi:type II secretory pathway pseudopilin PulG
MTQAKNKSAMQFLNVGQLLEKGVNMRSKTWKNNEEGSATIIALLVMVLLMAFVALAVSRTTTETLATANDETESKTFAAAQASLENATREFDQIFETKLTPSTTDISNVETNDPPGFGTDFKFEVHVTQTAQPYTASAGSFLQGLTALRDEWRVDSLVTHKATGVQVALRRAFYNDRIPIFQFGIFYNDDLEFHPGPRFDFGGRVHSNGNLFLMAETGLYFSSKVSSVGEVLTDVARNGRSSNDWGNNVFVRNGSGSYVQLGKNSGSVLHDVSNGSNVFANPQYAGQLPMPSAYKNANWAIVRESFQGNLISNARRLDLPLKISSKVAGAEMDYIELIRRGKELGDRYNSGGTPAAPVISDVTTANADGPITTKERYTNKAGIRISLADTRDKLPGCATTLTDATGNANRCGVRLDVSDGRCGAAGANACVAAPATGKGYQPKTMSGGTQNSKLNGDRLFSDATHQNWIKIELVSLDTSGVVNATDVTEDILSLGVTERASTISTSGTTMFRMDPSDYKSDTDKYSIIKLQRWMIPGGAAGTTGTDGAIRVIDTKCSTTYKWNSLNYEIINTTHTTSSMKDYLDCSAASPSVQDPYTKTANIRINTGDSAVDREITPFPIRMFDTREGLYNDSLNIATAFNNTVSTVTYQKVPENGSMGLIDIDVANLRLFLNGEDATVAGLLPASGTKFSDAKSRRLAYTDVPDSNGWVLYVSDRRGDYDFDGEYDMEDIFGNNDGQKQPGEDVNVDGVLETNYANEAPSYSQLLDPDLAAFKDPKWFRRAVRLINGSVIPGKYVAATPANTKGFTFASENGVYVLGNYNATGVTAIGSPTDPDVYQPHDTPNHIPASVVGDAITILSNNWVDGRSFRYPFTLAQRQATDTVDRFAMLSGDSISSLEADPNQGGGDPRLNGGVHNFKRFLEDWGGNTLSYSGSLINLYNSHNNNGAFKCCTNVYSPPNRDWTFDISFMDPTRLPPGTPFFQSINLTGFQRLND